MFKMSPYHRRVAILLAGLIFGGCSDSIIEPQLMPSDIELTEVFSTQLPSTELTVFSTNGDAGMDDIAEYPTNPWRVEGWKVEEWGHDLTPREVSALVEFVSSEREKYADTGEHSTQVQALDHILSDLSNWPVDHSAVSYIYKSKPGSSDYRYGDWLYVYHYDAETGTITRITNAFR